MKKVLGIAASPRKGGNSDVILQRILEAAARAGAVSEAVFLRDLNFNSCIGCEKCRKDKECTGQRDDMQSIYPRLIEAGGLVLVTPTHQYNVSALMKEFIDRLYCFYDFTDDRPRAWSSRLAGQDRKAVIAAIAEQEGIENMGFALPAMRLPLEALGYEVLGEMPVLGVFDRGAAAKDRNIMEQAEKLGQALASKL